MNRTPWAVLANSTVHRCPETRQGLQFQECRPRPFRLGSKLLPCARSGVILPRNAHRWSAVFRTVQHRSRSFTNVKLIKCHAAGAGRRLNRQVSGAWHAPSQPTLRRSVGATGPAHPGEPARLRSRIATSNRRRRAVLADQRAAGTARGTRKSWVPLARQRSC